MAAAGGGPVPGSVVAGMSRRYAVSGVRPPMISSRQLINISSVFQIPIPHSLNTPLSELPQQSLVVISQEPVSNSSKTPSHSGPIISQFTSR